MKFTGSFVGKFFLIIICLLLGVILAVGGEALAGYILLTRQGMVGTIADKVEDSVGSSGFELQFDDATKQMSLLDWGQSLAGSFSDMSKSTIGDMEKLLGINVISRMIEEAVGVPAAKIQESSISEVGKAISNNMTLNNAKTNLGVTFPDMPLFNNEEFLNKPLSTAFEGFNDYTLADVININESDANAVLKELRTTKIKDLGGKVTDEKIKGMFLFQIMTINESSSKTLKALKYSTIESFYEYEEDGITIKLDGLGNKIYKTKEVTEVIDSVEVKNTYPMKGINEMIDDLVMKDVVDITESSSAVLRKMRTPTDEEIAAGKADLFGTEDLKIKELGGSKVTDIIDGTKIGEIVTIVETDPVEPGDPPKSEPIMIALKDTTINGLNAKIKVLKLNEIFAEADLANGALSLIDPETTLNGIPAAMTAVMQTATTATLKGKGVIEASRFDGVSGLKFEQQAFVYNNNVGGMLQNMIEFIKTPANYGLIAPHQQTVAGASYASLSAFVAEYAQFDTVTFGVATVTISVDPDLDGAFYVDDSTDAAYGKYVIPMFNVKNAVSINIPNTVAIGVYDTTTVPAEKIADGNGVSYKGRARNQYGFAYTTDLATYNSTLGGYIPAAYATLMVQSADSTKIEVVLP